MENKLCDTVIEHFESLSSDVDKSTFINKLMNLVKDFLNNQVYDDEESVTIEQLKSQKVVQTVFDCILEHSKKGVLNVLVEEFLGDFQDV
jgi:dGTP triphosphohydrolase